LPPARRLPGIVARPRGDARPNDRLRGDARPNDRPSIVQGYDDPLATLAAGSLARWGRWTLDAWEDEHPLGDRLRPEEIPTFVGFALHKFHELAVGLAEVLVRVFQLMTR
jgi:hypothetical protein